MTTTVDIGNQALVAIGRRQIITNLSQDSTEAKVINSVYSSVTDWCLSLANWNFARKTAVLALTKSVSLPIWSAASPAPPWINQFALPTDIVKAVYLTNNDQNGDNTSYAGEPKRFAMSTDGLLTNESVANLVYVSRVSDPTLWPGYFVRFAVTALAWHIISTLEGDAKLQYFDDLCTRHFIIAEQINREEGLVFGDTTPEWIQALGINYPLRRTENPGMLNRTRQQRAQGDNAS